jgi:hypothetical protein
MKVPPLLGRSLSGGSFTIHEWTDEGESSPEWPIAPLHLHERDEAWYVLEGTLGFRYDDDLLEAPAGSGVLVPAGVVHTFWNAGPGRARYLLVLPPRIEALIEALHDPSRPDDLHELFHRFDSRLVD